MKKRNIEIHTFSIFSKDDLTTPLEHTDINGVNLYEEIIKNFVQFVDDTPTDVQRKRVIQFSRKSALETDFKFSNKRKTISGKIVTGQYGKIENVIDVNSDDKTPIFQIKNQHAIQKPFFFMICLPQNRKKGFLLLEREGQYGIKDLFTYVFKKFIREKFPNYILNFSNLIDEEIIKNHVTNGDLNSITLTRKFLPRDIAEKYGLKDFKSQDLEVQLVIKTKGGVNIVGLAKKRVLNMINENPQGFFEDKDFGKIGFDNDSDVKIESTYRNSKRTIDLSDFMKFKPYYEVMVDINSEGHSDFDSIENESVKLLSELNIDII